MSATPIVLRRPALFAADELGRIEEATFRILEGVGVAVGNDRLLERLKGLGLAVNESGRVTMERKLVRRFLDEERKSNGNSFSTQPRRAEPRENGLRASLIRYPQHVHDVETDDIVPFTTERLIEAVRLCDALAERGLVNALPGLPTDVPPKLQPVLQYWIAATHARRGRGDREIQDVASAPYLMEMAEVLGRPVRWLPVYVFSPLRLGGESLEYVTALRDRLDGISVGSMPSAGCTAPINVGDAFALAAAEVVGSAILLGEALSMPVRWHVSLFPIDMRSLAMVFGSPESLLLQFMSAEVNAFFHGAEWHPAATNIHTNAKLPGPQAAAEKGMILSLGALLGAREFGSVGALSLDEVFSAEQLLYDLELKDHVERLVRGMAGDCDPARALADVREAVELGGFAGLDTTLRSFRELYWMPRLFERDLLAGYKSRGSESIRKRARAELQQLLKGHEYELEPEKQKAIDAVLERARRELA